MKTMKKFRLFLTVILVVFSINACQKDQIADENDNLIIEQETIAEQTLVDLDALVDEALGIQFSFLKSTASSEGDYYVNKCPVITFNQTANPKVLTIDFGTSCTGKDGKVRSGKILVSSTSVENFAFTRTKTFDNFFVDGKKIEGTITKTITLNREDHSKVAQVVEDVTITFPDNKGKATRKATLTRDYQLNVLGVPKDNVIESWGKVEFTRVNGLKITKTIAEADPLVFKMACHQIVSGVIAVSTSDNRTWSIDYGDGECDNKAVVTKNGEPKEIKIR
jgi:hypothetical protein